MALASQKLFFAQQFYKTEWRRCFRERVSERQQEVYMKALCCKKKGRGLGGSKKPIKMSGLD